MVQIIDGLQRCNTIFDEFWLRSQAFTRYYRYQRRPRILAIILGSSDDMNSNYSITDAMVNAVMHENCCIYLRIISVWLAKIPVQSV